MANRPKKNEEKMDKIITAWETLAPNAVFGGITLDEYKAIVVPCKTKRKELAVIEDQRTAIIDERDDADEVGLNKGALVVNGVIGDPNFGPNSPLYEAMGYVRKSERKSGLTRKKKVAPTDG